MHPLLATLSAPSEAASSLQPTEVSGQTASDDLIVAAEADANEISFEVVFADTEAEAPREVFVEQDGPPTDMNGRDIHSEDMDAKADADLPKPDGNTEVPADASPVVVKRGRETDQGILNLSTPNEPEPDIAPSLASGMRSNIADETFARHSQAPVEASQVLPTTRAHRSIHEMAHATVAMSPTASAATQPAANPRNEVQTPQASPAPSPVTASQSVEPRNIPASGDLPVSRHAKVQTLPQQPAVKPEALKVQQLPTEETAIPVPRIAAERDAPPLTLPLKAAAKPQQARLPLTSTVSAQPIAMVVSDNTGQMAAAEADPLTAPRSDIATTAANFNAGTIPARQDLPQHVARQIADALQQMPNRPVEITLQPEELGRVRLGVSTSEGNITVSVLAERPETADLMRRHIGNLEQAFQHLGYRDISFAFSQNGSSRDDGREQPESGSDRPNIMADSRLPGTTHIHLSAAPLTGIDIRL